MSISLWESDDDLQQNQARGAQMRKEANSELGIASPAADIYEVLLEA